MTRRCKRMNDLDGLGQGTGRHGVRTYGRVPTHHVPAGRAAGSLDQQFCWCRPAGSTPSCTAQHGGPWRRGVPWAARVSIVSLLFACSCSVCVCFVAVRVFPCYILSPGRAGSLDQQLFLVPAGWFFASARLYGHCLQTKNFLKFFITSNLKYMHKVF